MVQHIILFVSMVFGKWQGYATGGGITALVHLFERMAGKTLPKKVYVSIFVISFLLVAGFVAWREEFTSAEWRGQYISFLQGELKNERENKKPKFDAEIGFSGEGTLFGSTTVIVGLQLRNRGGMDSGIHNWRMFVNLDDGTRVDGQIPPPLGNDLKSRVPGTKAFTDLKPSEYLPRATMQPIKAGGAVGGWLWAQFPTLTEKQLFDRKAVITVEFNDIVTDEIHSITRPIGKPGVHGVGYGMKP